jgi:hypothetical protein
MQVPHESPDMGSQARVSPQGRLLRGQTARPLLVPDLAGAALVFACSNSSLKEPHLKHPVAVLPNTAAGNALMFDMPASRVSSTLQTTL